MCPVIPFGVNIWTDNMKVWISSDMRGDIILLCCPDSESVDDYTIGYKWYTKNRRLYAQQPQITIVMMRSRYI